jgi:hypothetical protein
MLSGSDGDLAGSGADLDVVAALDQVVVGAPPIGLPPGAPDADVVDGQLGGPTPDADPDGHTDGPDQLEDGVDRWFAWRGLAGVPGLEPISLSLRIHIPSGPVVSVAVP